MPPYRKGVWLPEEDELLLSCLALCRQRDWRKISELMSTRAPKQCSERYNEHLRAGLDRSPLTGSERDLVQRLVHAKGTCWVYIAGHLVNRSPAKIKNWWYSQLNKRQRRSRHERTTFRNHKPSVEASSGQSLVRFEGNSCSSAWSNEHSFTVRINVKEDESKECLDQSGTPISNIPPRLSQPSDALVPDDMSAWHNIGSELLEQTHASAAAGNLPIVPTAESQGSLLVWSTSYQRFCNVQTNPESIDLVRRADGIWWQPGAVEVRQY